MPHGFYRLEKFAFWLYYYHSLSIDSSGETVGSSFTVPKDAVCCTNIMRSRGAIVVLIMPLFAALHHIRRLVAVLMKHFLLFFVVAMFMSSNSESHA